MHNTPRFIPANSSSSVSSSVVNSVSDLYQACREGDEELVRGLLISLEYTHVNCVEPNGSTALHAAAYFGHANVVRLLLNFQVDRRQRNLYGLTAYQEAKTDEIRQLFHRPIQTHSRFCDDQSQILGIVDEQTLNEVNEQVPSSWVSGLETERQISQYRQLLAMGKYLWRSEWAQVYFRLYNRYVRQNADADMNCYIARLERLIDENFPPNSTPYPAIRRLFDEYKQSRRPESLFTIYTLDSPFYTLMTESSDNSCVLVLLIWRYLNSLTPRFFRGTSYRGLSITHSDLQAYRWAMESTDRIIRTFVFCSSSTERSVAEFYGDMALSDRIRVLMIFNFDRPCDGAIQLYSLSTDLPCISHFENELEVLILPGTLFRVWKIELDSRTGHHLIYLNHIPDAENPGWLSAQNLFAEVGKNLNNFFSFFR